MSDQVLAFIDWLNTTAPLWWQSMGVAAVQAGLVAGLSLALVRFGRNWSAALRYGILLIVLLKFALAPLLLLPSRSNDRITLEYALPEWGQQSVAIGPTPSHRPEEIRTTPLSESVEHTPKPEPILPAPAVSYEEPSILSLISLPGWCWLLHLSGSVIVILGLLWQWLGLCWLVWARSVPADGSILALYRAIQDELNYQRPVQIRVSRYAPAPIAFKLVRPTIVLPAVTIDKLDEEDLSAVLAHEVAHLRRHDPLVNIIQILLLGIWWFHPLYWLLVRQLRSTREECCDDLVLAKRVTQDDRYCQVLLDAARASLCATTGGAILGFGESAESMHKRMQRIMSPRTRRAAGIGICAGLVLLVLAVVFMPMWRSNATINNPRPVTDTGLSPGPLQSLAIGLNLQKYPRLEMDARQEADLKACIKLSRLTNSSVNGKPRFDEPEVKEELLALQQGMLDPFYAEFLLSKWHERNNETDQAQQWMQQSLDHASAVLIRRYQFMDGRPLAHTPVGRLGVECRMKTATSSNGYNGLEYISLITDEKGQVYLPCYDTKIRCNSVQHPRGYEIETGRHGYLELHARYCLLPTIYVWKKGHPRPATSLPTSAFYHYKEATQAKGLKHRLNHASFRIERCFRLNGDGSIAATDGRQAISLTPDEQTSQFPERHASLDQAAIRFKRDSLSGHEILQARIFDHRTRALLSQYHAPAAWDYNGQDEISFKSFGRTLPERVDVWFWVTQFGPEDMRQTVPAQVGATVEFQDYRALLSDLRGAVTSYSTTPNGIISVKADAREDDSRILAAFMITPKRSRRNRDYARVAAVCKDGTRILYDRVIYLQNRSIACDFHMKLSELDHFELYPIGQESYFYFDGVSLPRGQGRPLEDSWEAVIDTQGQTGPFPAAQSGPGKVIVTVLPGSSSMSHTSRQLLNSHSQAQWSRGEKIRNPDTESTLVCELRGLSARMLKTEIIPLDVNRQPIEDSSGFGRSGSVVYRQFRVPASDIQSVHVKLTWSAED
jgi:beta-lactamase regulating signal transducer with metallopeptidase domain